MLSGTLGTQESWQAVVEGLRAAVEDPARGWETIAIVVGVPILVTLVVWANVRAATWLIRRTGTRG